MTYIYLFQIRNGTAAFWPNLEDLFYKYGVDLQYYAHEHSYERLWPIYKSKVSQVISDAAYNLDQHGTV